MARIAVSVPSELSSNPVKALRVFLEDKLGVELKINIKESFESPEVKLYTSTMSFTYLSSEEVISTFKHRGRKYARNSAAVAAIRRLNDDKELVLKYANIAFRNKYVLDH